MKKFFLQRKVQKSFLMLAFVCLIPMWLMLNQGVEDIPTGVYILGALAAVFFILDRFFKPWETERAEAKMKRHKQAARRRSPCGKRRRQNPPDRKQNKEKRGAKNSLCSAAFYFLTRILLIWIE